MNSAKRQLPDHPYAPAAQEALRQLESMLSSWSAETSGENLLLVTQLRCDSTQLRVWIGPEQITVAAAVMTVPGHPHILTWILTENLDQEFKAFATPSSHGQVPVSVMSSYPSSALPELGRLIWAGFGAALTWRGRLWQVKVPNEPGTPG